MLAEDESQLIRCQVTVCIFVDIGESVFQLELLAAVEAHAKALGSPLSREVGSPRSAVLVPSVQVEEVVGRTSFTSKEVRPRGQQSGVFFGDRSKSSTEV